MKKNFTDDRLAEITLGRKDIAIIGVRPTKNKEVVQLVFAQNIEKPGRVNLLARQMKGHESFSSEARPFWLNFTLSALKQDFPDLLAPAKQCIKDEDYVSVTVMNPTIDGYPVAVRIVESLRARKSDMQDIKQAIKKYPGTKPDTFIFVVNQEVDEDGVVHNYAIFSRAELTYKDILEEQGHDFITDTETTPDFSDVEVKERPAVVTDDKAEKAQQAQEEIVDQEEEPAEEQTVTA